MGLPRNNNHGFRLMPLVSMLLMIFLCSYCDNSKKEARAKEAALKKAAEEKAATEKAAVVEAIKGFRRIEAATEVGCTYMKYGEILIEAKTLVNEALLITTDTVVNEKLVSIMECYQDALYIWTQEIKWPGRSTIFAGWNDEAGRIFNRYSLPADRSISITSAVQHIWAKAKSELADLSYKLGSGLSKTSFCNQAIERTRILISSLQRGR